MRGVGYACTTEPALFTLYGVQVGILAYQTFDGAYDRLYTQVPEDIAALKTRGAELVICAFHWGDGAGLLSQLEPAEAGQDRHRRRRGPGGGAPQPPHQPH